MELSIFYSVRNGGDGSAYPTFMESMQLAEWDQNHMYEGWGESCTGELKFKSDSDIVSSFEIVTKESYYLDYLINDSLDNNEIRKFINEFFPNGVPEFAVVVIDKNYYGIYLNGELIDKKWNSKTSIEGALTLKHKINSKQTI
jgi:hypothetical protein